MAKPLTYNYVKEYIEGENGKGCILLTSKNEFEKIREKMRIKKLGVSHGILKILCGTCKKEIFYITFMDFKKKCNCDKCTKLRLLQEEKIRVLKRILNFNKNLRCLNINEYESTNDKLILKDKNNYIYNITIFGLKLINKRKGKLRKFGQGNDYFLHNIKNYLKINNINYIVKSKNLITTTEDIEFICDKNHKFYMSWNEFQNGTRCPICDIKNRSGINHWKYNPNITKKEREKKRLYLGEEIYNNWHNSVFERDNYTCQCCGDNHGGNLEAHHINSYNWDKENRFNIDNGITLCNKCHKKFHHLYGYGNNTKKQFEEFYQLYASYKVNIKSTNNNLKLKKIKENQKIIQFDLKGNVIKEWDNIYEIKKKLYYIIKDIRYIKRCCDNKVKTAYGFIWSFKKDINIKNFNKEDFLMIHNNSTNKAVIQLDLQNNFIHKWDSLLEADKKTHINFKNISACCRHKRKTTHGYKWIFAEEYYVE